MLKRNINNYLLIYLLRSIIFSLLSFAPFFNCEICCGYNPDETHDLPTGRVVIVFIVLQKRVV